MDYILNHSPLDSRRFGVKVFRGHITKVHRDELSRELISLCGDVYIIRIDAGSSLGVPTICQKLLMPCVHADTLVYYTCDLTRHQPQALRNTDIQFSRATAEDTDELQALVRQTFAGYISHYHANPMFRSEDILDGYIEWAMSHATAASTHLWLARRKGVLVAFAACKTLDSGEMEGVLYGVSPCAAGGGLYGDLIRFTQATAREMGIDTMIVSTQVHNFAVQKVWAREGFHLYKALDTFHINAMLSTGEVLVDRELCLSAEQLRQFAISTGDTNLIHIDSEAAKLTSFDNSIVHSVLCGAEFSRILGNEVPISDTVISMLGMTFFHPVLADKKYRLTIHAPSGLRDAPMEIIMKIKDDDQLCVLSRCHIVMRR